VQKYALLIGMLFLTLIGKSQLSIQLVDQEFGQGVPGASVYTLPDSTLYVSNEKGLITIPEASYIINIVAIVIDIVGYESVVILQNEFLEVDHLKIALAPLGIRLNEVLIMEDHAKHEHSLASIHLNEKYFNKNNAGTLSQALSTIPGLQSMETGPGIGKPVIRGLFGNRVIVNKDYIKQEGQQWGNDHGLELDPFDAQRVEIVKGPASLQYGSDGLGGIINILPPLLPKEGTVSGEFRNLYKTNNNHRASTIQLSGKKNNYFLHTRFSVQEFDDFRVPAENFVYNGFELPLYNGRVKNTAGKERSFTVMGGYQSTKRITRLTYSGYHLNAGIFSGAVGIPRSYILTDDGDPSNIDVPFQKVVHQRLTMNHISFIGDNHFSLNIGYQFNNRQEHSRPESHSRFEIDDNETKAIQLRLQTWSYESHYEYKHKDKARSVIGTNGQYQVNSRDGFEFLLPDFQLWRVGVFYFLEKPLHHDWTISGGVRYDLGQNINNSFYLERRDRQGNLFATTEVLASERLFHNYSASFGAYYDKHSGNVIRLNAGKTYRIPYPNETSSNGIHHGNFRHEIGNADLVSEEGYQLDMSYEYETKKFSFQFSGFFNYFNDYIYLRPTPSFSSLPEAGLLFEYEQHDAIYTGFEFELTWKLKDDINFRQAFEYIHSYNLNTGLALPFTPPNSIRSELSRSTQWKHFDLEATLVHRYVFRNDLSRIDRFEQVTPGFHLLDLFLQINSNRILNGLTAQVQVSNLFNVSYFNHLSRYRLLNLPEMGRNIIFNLKIPILFKLK